MNAIELMNEEHKNILRIIKVVRKVCFNIMKGTEINYKDLEDIIEFIRNYADSHHHKKEEDILFNRITENLGQLGEKLVKHGMLVEHDYGRLYISNLVEAIEKVNNGDYRIYSDCDDMTDIAYQVVEECEYLNNVPNNVARYFDYEEFGRDLGIEGTYIFLDNNEAIEVF